MPTTTNQGFGNIVLIVAIIFTIAFLLSKSNLEVGSTVTPQCSVQSDCTGLAYGVQSYQCIKQQCVYCPSVRAFYGKVTKDNVPYPDNTKIDIKNNNQYATESIYTFNGTYGYNSNVQACKNSNTFDFYINDEYTSSLVTTESITEFNINYQTCVPKSCTEQGFNCGVHSNLCGQLLDCNTCTAVQTCNSGVCQDKECSSNQCITTIDNNITVDECKKSNNNIYFNSMNYTDYCYTNSILMEYSCNVSNVVSQQLNAPQGFVCYNGKFILINDTSAYQCIYDTDCGYGFVCENHYCVAKTTTEECPAIVSNLPTYLKMEASCDTGSMILIISAVVLILGFMFMAGRK